MVGASARMHPTVAIVRAAHDEMVETDAAATVIAHHPAVAEIGEEAEVEEAGAGAHGTVIAAATDGNTTTEMLASLALTANHPRALAAHLQALGETSTRAVTARAQLPLQKQRLMWTWRSNHNGNDLKAWTMTHGRWHRSWDLRASKAPRTPKCLETTKTMV